MRIATYVRVYGVSPRDYRILGFPVTVRKALVLSLTKRISDRTAVRGSVDLSSNSLSRASRSEQKETNKIIITQREAHFEVN